MDVDVDVREGGWCVEAEQSVRLTVLRSYYPDAFFYVSQRSDTSMIIMASFT